MCLFVWESFSIFSFLPLLTLWWWRSVPSFIILFRNIIPVGWQNCSATCLEAFHHCSSFIRISIFENFFEKLHSRIFSIVLRMSLDVSFNFLPNLIPVLFCFGAWGIVDLCFFFGFWKSLSILSKREPVQILLLLLHHNFDACKPVNLFRPCCDNASKEF